MASDERQRPDGEAKGRPSDDALAPSLAERRTPAEVPARVEERDDPRSATVRRPRPPADEVRIGDRERQVVVDQLREAVGSGHLTLDEFAERVEAAWQAVVPSELTPLVRDLPVASTVTSGRTVEVPNRSPREATGSSGRSRVTAIMGGTDTRGRWRVAPEVRALGFWGSATVDLREALIESSTVDIRATAIMGGVTVIVPEGIPVELDGMVLMGGCSNRARTDGVHPGAPVVRVHASGLWGGVEVRTKALHRDRAPHREALDEIREALDLAGTVAPASGLGRPGPNRRRGRSGDLPEGTLTIMFTDIVDSTAAVEKMGDRRWSQVVATHDRSLRRIVDARGGTVLKGNGDGYLVVFPSALQAVLAGIEVRDGADVALRIGLHTGEVVRQDDDVYGRNVIAAARIAGAADPDQVVVSALTKDLVDSSGDLAFSPGRTVELKGLAQPWTIHDVRLSATT